MDDPATEAGDADDPSGEPGEGGRPRAGASVPDAGDPEASARRAAGGDPPRAFAVGYERQSGDMLVWGGVAIAVLGVVAAIVNGADGFLVLTALGLGSSAYFWPLVERQRPQLGASATGLYVDRIGIIGWPAVAGLELHQTALRSMQLATMRVRLRVPLDKAVVAAERVPITKRFTTRNWKEAGDVLEIRLHTLRGHPPDVFERIKAFHDLSSGVSRS